MNINKLFASDKMQALRYRMVSEELYRSGYDESGRFAYYYFSSAYGKSYMCTDIYTGIVWIFNIITGCWDRFQRNDLLNFNALEDTDPTVDILWDFKFDKKIPNKVSKNSGVAKSKTDQLILSCQDSLFATQKLLSYVNAIFEDIPDLESSYDKDLVETIKHMYSYILDNNNRSSSAFNKLAFINGILESDNIFAPPSGYDKYVYATPDQRHRLIEGDPNWYARYESDNSWLKANTDFFDMGWDKR